MYCKQCGKKINKEVRFCPFCGTEQKRRNTGKANVSSEKETKEDTQEESQKVETTSLKSNEEQNNEEVFDKIEDNTDSSKEKAKENPEKKTESQTKDNDKDKKTDSWNSWRSLLGPIYYFQEGIWKKGLLLLSGIFIVSGILFNIFLQTSFFWIFFVLYISVFEYMSRKDIVRKKQNNETMWKELPPFFNKDIVVVISIVVSAFVLFISSDNARKSRLEENVEPVVTDVLQDNYGLDYTCDNVNITEEYDNNNYRAAATLDDNSVIHVNIETYPRDKDNFNVQVPYEEVYLME